MRSLQLDELTRCARLERPHAYSDAWRFLAFVENGTGLVAGGGQGVVYYDLSTGKPTNLASEFKAIAGTGADEAVLVAEETHNGYRLCKFSKSGLVEDDGHEVRELPTAFALSQDGQTSAVLLRSPSEDRWEVSSAYLFEGTNALEVRCPSTDSDGYPIQSHTRALGWSAAPMRLAIAGVSALHLAAEPKNVLEKMADTLSNKRMSLRSPEVVGGTRCVTDAYSVTRQYQHQLASLVWPRNSEEIIVIDSLERLRRVPVDGCEWRGVVGYPVSIGLECIHSARPFSGRLVAFAGATADNSQELHVLDPFRLKTLLIVRGQLGALQNLTVCPHTGLIARIHDHDGHIDIFDLSPHISDLPSCTTRSDVELALDDIAQRFLDGKSYKKIELLRRGIDVVQSILGGLAEADEAGVNLTWKGWSKSRFASEANQAGDDLLEIIRDCLRAEPPRMTFSFDELVDSHALVQQHRRLLSAMAETMGFKVRERFEIPDVPDWLIELEGIQDSHHFFKAMPSLVDKSSDRSGVRRLDNQAGLAKSDGQSLDHCYIVYCRLVGLKTMANDEVAGAVQGLAEVLETQCAGRDVAAHSSVYGRFAVIPRDVSLAVWLAKLLVEETASRGVQIAVGIASGRVETVRDLQAVNLAGHAINVAARLAFLSAEAGWVAAQSEVADDAETAAAEFRGAFGPKQEGKVKQTFLEYRRLEFGPPKLGSAVVPNADCVSEFAHAVVYDIVHYSGQELAAQVSLAESLRARVSRALESAGGARITDGEERWYSPGGDGGVLVFASGDKGGARAAWTFARELRKHCNEAVPIRIGVASGQVVLLPQSLPIGSGILIADQASGFPGVGEICAHRRFWESSLEPPDRDGWTAKSVESSSNFLFLEAGSK